MQGTRDDLPVMAWTLTSHTLYGRPEALHSPAQHATWQAWADALGATDQSTTGPGGHQYLRARVDDVHGSHITVVLTATVYADDYIDEDTDLTADDVPGGTSDE